MTSTWTLRGYREGGREENLQLYLIAFVTVRVAVILVVFRAGGLLMMTLACWNKICIKHRFPSRDWGTAVRCLTGAQFARSSKKRSFIIAESSAGRQALSRVLSLSMTKRKWNIAGKVSRLLARRASSGILSSIIPTRRERTFRSLLLKCQIIRQFLFSESRICKYASLRVPISRARIRGRTKKRIAWILVHAMGEKWTETRDGRYRD